MQARSIAIGAKFGCQSGRPTVERLNCKQGGAGLVEQIEAISVSCAADRRHLRRIDPGLVEALADDDRRIGPQLLHVALDVTRRR